MTASADGLDQRQIGPPRRSGKGRNRYACCIGIFTGNCSKAAPKAAFSTSAAERLTSRNSGRTSYRPISCRFRGSMSSPTRIGCRFRDEILCRRGDARRAASSGTPDRIPEGSVARAETRRAPCDDRAGDDDAGAQVLRSFSRRARRHAGRSVCDRSTINPDRDPFDANQAIPTLLFATAPARQRVEQAIPSLRRTKRRLAEPARLSDERRISEMVVDSSRAGRPDAGLRAQDAGPDPKTSGVPDDGRAGAAGIRRRSPRARRCADKAAQVAHLF